MAKLSDPQGFEKRIEDELQRAKDSDQLADETADALFEFAEAHREGRVPDDEELSDATVGLYLNRTRLAAERLNGTFPEADKDTYETLMEQMSYEYAVGTYNLTVSGVDALSRFHGWGFAGVADRMERETPSVDPDRVFEDEEVNTLLDEAGPVDAAIVAVLADTGCRVGALASFRVRDVDRSGAVPELRFNTESNVKTATGKILLSWSKGYLDDYLEDEHPCPGDPDAPLIHKTMHYDADDPYDDGAFHTDTIRKRLKNLGEAAGIARDRMKPHNFRHTAVSNWIRQGFTPEDIVHRASWASPRMLDIYDNVTDEQMNESIAVKMGIVDEEDVASDPSEVTIDCPQCQTTIRRSAKVCPVCNLALNQQSASEVKDGELPGAGGPMPGEVDDGVWADGAGAEIPDEMETETLLAKLLEREDVDPSELTED